jgi:hypothetical protein
MLQNSNQYFADDNVCFISLGAPDIRGRMYLREGRIGEMLSLGWVNESPSLPRSALQVRDDSWYA